MIQYYFATLKELIIIRSIKHRQLLIFKKKKGKTIKPGNDVHIMIREHTTTRGI